MGYIDSWYKFFTADFEGKNSKVSLEVLFSKREVFVHLSPDETL